MPAVDDSKYPETIAVKKGGGLYVRDASDGVVVYKLAGNETELAHCWTAKWEAKKERLYFVNKKDKAQREWKLPAGPSASSSADAASPDGGKKEKKSKKDKKSDDVASADKKDKKDKKEKKDKKDKKGRSGDHEASADPFGVPRAAAATAATPFDAFAVPATAAAAPSSEAPAQSAAFAAFAVPRAAAASDDEGDEDDDSAASSTGSAAASAPATAPGLFGALAASAGPTDAPVRRSSVGSIHSEPEGAAARDDDDDEATAAAKRAAVVAQCERNIEERDRELREQLEAEEAAEEERLRRLAAMLKASEAKDQEADEKPRMAEENAMAEQAAAAEEESRRQRDIAAATAAAAEEAERKLRAEEAERVAAEEAAAAAAAEAAEVAERKQRAEEEEEVRKAAENAQRAREEAERIAAAEAARRQAEEAEAEEAELAAAEAAAKAEHAAAVEAARRRDEQEHEQQQQQQQQQAEEHEQQQQEVQQAEAKHTVQEAEEAEEAEEAARIAAEEEAAAAAAARFAAAREAEQRAAEKRRKEEAAAAERAARAAAEQRSHDEQPIVAKASTPLVSSVKNSGASTPLPAPSAATAPTAASDDSDAAELRRGELRISVVEFLSAHAPEELSTVDALIDQYGDHGPMLMQLLERRHHPATKELDRLERESSVYSEPAMSDASVPRSRRDGSEVSAPAAAAVAGKAEREIDDEEPSPSPPRASCSDAEFEAALARAIHFFEDRGINTDPSEVSSMVQDFAGDEGGLGAMWEYLDGRYPMPTTAHVDVASASNTAAADAAPADDVASGRRSASPAQSAASDAGHEQPVAQVPAPATTSGSSAPQPAVASIPLSPAASEGSPHDVAPVPHNNSNAAQPPMATPPADAATAAAPPAAPPAADPRERYLDDLLAPTAAEIAATRDRVERMFRHYDPSRLHAVDELMEAHRGREAALVSRLVDRYGPEPPSTVDHAAPPPPPPAVVASSGIVASPAPAMPRQPHDDDDCDDALSTISSVERARAEARLLAAEAVAESEAEDAARRLEAAVLPRMEQIIAAHNAANDRLAEIKRARSESPSGGRHGTERADFDRAEYYRLQAQASLKEEMDDFYAPFEQEFERLGVSRAARPAYLEELRQRDQERLYAAAVDTMLLDSAEYCAATVRAFQDFIRTAPSPSPARGRPAQPAAAVALPPPPQPSQPRGGAAAVTDEDDAPSSPPELASTKRDFVVDPATAPPAPAAEPVAAAAAAMVAPITQPVAAAPPAVRAASPAMDSPPRPPTDDQPQDAGAGGSASPQSPSPDKAAAPNVASTALAPAADAPPEDKFKAALAAIRALREAREAASPSRPRGGDIEGSDDDPAQQLIDNFAAEVERYATPRRSRSPPQQQHQDVSLNHATPSPPPEASPIAAADVSKPWDRRPPLPWRRVLTPRLPDASRDAMYPDARVDAASTPGANRSRHDDAAASYLRRRASDDAAAMGHGGTPPPRSPVAPPLSRSPATPADEPKEAFLQWDKKRSGDIMLTSDATAARMDPAGNARLFYCLGTLGVCRGEFAFEVLIQAPSDVFTAANFFAVGVACKRYRGPTGPPCASYVLRSDGAVLSQSDSSVGVKFLDHALPSTCRITVHVDLNKWQMSFYADSKPLGVGFRFTPISDPEPLFPVILFGRAGGSAVLVPPQAELPDRVSPSRVRVQRSS